MGTELYTVAILNYCLDVYALTPSSLFGGDASRVTISGESAGGGSVMLQDMAYGGTQGDFLFSNVR